MESKNILFLSSTDGKSSGMAMTATTSSGDTADMDCSPAEIEEFIKEVRLIPISNHSSNYVSHLYFCPLSCLF